MSDHELHIEPGDYFSKNELKSRLLQMDIECDTYQEKNFYARLYNEAIKSEAARTKIKDRLKKDTEYYLERQGTKTRQRDRSEEPSIIPQKLAKLDREENKQAMKDMLVGKNKPEIIKKYSIDTYVPEKSTVVIPRDELPKDTRISDPVKPVEKISDLKGKAFAPVVSTTRLNYDFNNIRPIVKTSSEEIGRGMTEHSSSLNMKNPLLFPNREVINESLFRRSDDNKKVSSNKVIEKVAQPQPKKFEEVWKGSQKELNYEDLIPKVGRVTSQMDVKPAVKTSSLSNSFIPGKTVDDNSVNGAILNNASIDSNLIVNKPSKIKEITLKDFLKIRESETGSKMNLLSKYLILGCATTVMFFGIKYSLEYNPELLNIPMEYIGKLFDKTQTAVTEAAGKLQVLPLTQSTTTSEESIFRTIYNILTNPVGYLWNLALNFIWGKIYAFVLWTLASTIFWYAYRQYQYKSNSKKIFNAVKYDLKNLVDQNDPEHGLSEDFIINKYSNEYCYSESVFKTKIFPELKKLRVSDGYIREFESYSNGRRKILWQYYGY
jgi:hypothetical protein